MPGPEGVGKDKAIDGYARWMTEQYMAGCKFQCMLMMTVKANQSVCVLQYAKPRDIQSGKERTTPPASL